MRELFDAWCIVCPIVIPRIRARLRPTVHEAAAPYSLGSLAGYAIMRTLGVARAPGTLWYRSHHCLLAALLSRGEHTCSFYVSRFSLFLGTAPTNVIEWLTVCISWDSSQ